MSEVTLYTTRPVKERMLVGSNPAPSDGHAKMASIGKMAPLGIGKMAPLGRRGVAAIGGGQFCDPSTLVVLRGVSGFRIWGLGFRV